MDLQNRAVYRKHLILLSRFYNTTYTVFAASIILVYVMREATAEGSAPLLKQVDMAIEILEIMDECVVALEAARLLRRGKEKAERILSSTPGLAPVSGGVPPTTEGQMFLNPYWGPMDLLQGGMDLDFVFELNDFENPGAIPASNS